ncbi:MAG: hypothetical protein PHP45_08755, partial [Elusimicrobiales bacterium]|nr:hypothetical protein [Elusimicrobiales bacterium]
MPPKIAILYGHEPSGHVTTARAVGEQLALRGAEVSYIDLSRDFYRHSGELVSGFYLEVLSRAPIFWRIVYDNPLLVALSRPGRKLYLKLSGDARRMADMLDDGGFDAAVCTHSLPCFVLSLSCKKPLFGVVTDFSAHHFWPEENVAAYFVHEETARDDMISRQISPEKVIASGIPVSAAYAKPVPQDAALRGFRLNPSIPCAMLCGGSKGMGDMEKCFNTLAGIDGLQLIVACGSNRRLFMQLTRRAAGMPRVRVLAD